MKEMMLIMLMSNYIIQIQYYLAKKKKVKYNKINTKHFSRRRPSIVACIFHWVELENRAETKYKMTKDSTKIRNNLGQWGHGHDCNSIEPGKQSSNI